MGAEQRFHGHYWCLVLWYAISLMCLCQSATDHIVFFLLAAGIPFFGETEFSIDTSYSQTWTYGGSNEFSKTWSASFTAKASPGESVHAVSTVTRGQLEVPYTMVLRSKANKVEAQTRGMWHGVSTWDLRHTVSTVDE